MALRPARPSASRADTPLRRVLEELLADADGARARAHACQQRYAACYPEPLATWYDRAQAWLREADLDEPVGEYGALATFAACTPAQCRLMPGFEAAPASAELAEFAALLQDYQQCYLGAWKATALLLLDALPPRLRTVSEVPADTKDLYELLSAREPFSQIYLAMRHSNGSFEVERSTVPCTWLHRTLLDPKVREDNAWEAMKDLIVPNPATHQRRTLAEHCENFPIVDAHGRVHEISSLPSSVLGAACLELAREAERQRGNAYSQLCFRTPELLQAFLTQDAQMQRLVSGELVKLSGMYERILAMDADAARAEGHRMAALYGSEAQRRFLRAFGALQREREEQKREREGPKRERKEQKRERKEQRRKRGEQKRKREEQKRKREDLKRKREDLKRKREEEDQVRAQCLDIEQELKGLKLRKQQEYEEGVQLWGYGTATRPRRDPFLLKKRGFLLDMMQAEDNGGGLPAWKRTPPALALRVCSSRAPSSFMLAQYHMTHVVCAWALDRRAGGTVACCIHPESFELLPVLSAAECDEAAGLYKDYRLPATAAAEHVAALRRRLAALTAGEDSKFNVVYVQSVQQELSLVEASLGREAFGSMRALPSPSYSRATTHYKLQQKAAQLEALGGEVVPPAIATDVKKKSLLLAGWCLALRDHALRLSGGRPMARLKYTFDCMTLEDAELLKANQAGIRVARNELKQVFLDLCARGELPPHFWIDRSAVTGWVQILYPKQASGHFYRHLIMKFTSRSQEAEQSPPVPAPDREEYPSAAAA